MNRRLGVLISGRGSNLQAILNAIRSGQLDADVGLVVSNRPDAAGLVHAQDFGIETIVLEHGSFPDRADYDRAIVHELKSREIGLVCLAGFMRILSSTFLEAYPNAVLNIHPSLLPAFRGTDAQAQAITHGVKIAGATVHFVTRELDAGPIVLQASVLVHDEDTAETLAARILTEEHKIYPEAIDIVLRGYWKLVGRIFVRVDVGS